MALFAQRQAQHVFAAEDHLTALILLTALLLVAPRHPAAIADRIGAALDRPLRGEQVAEAIVPYGCDAVLAWHFAVPGRADS